MEPSLDGVYAKLDRADEHLKLLDREIRAFIETDPQPIGLSVGYFDPQSGYHIVYGVVTREPPVRLGVILGDMVHNARSALDHLVRQLVLLNGAKPNGNAFPMASTEGDWNAIVSDRLRGVSTDHRAIIEKVQPYQGKNGPEWTYTGMLSHLSNVDKHRVVHPAVAMILDPGADPHRANFRITEGTGRIVREQVNWGHRFEHGAEMMRARTEPADPDTKVDVEGDVPAEIAFGKRLIPSGHIDNIPQAVRVIVREFEADFP